MEGIIERFTPLVPSVQGCSLYNRTLTAMKRYDSLKDAIISLVESMIGEGHPHLYYTVRWIDEKRIRLEFARYDTSKGDYVRVGLVNENGNIGHIKKVWHREVFLPKLMREVEEIASRAHRQHMSWVKKREDVDSE
jgi:hypothetical protein